MSVLLLAVAAVWGAGSGQLIPRIAYRLAVEPDEPWRAECPGGHSLTGPLGGWLGRARCTADEAVPGTRASEIADMCIARMAESGSLDTAEAEARDPGASEGAASAPDASGADAAGRATEQFTRPAPPVGDTSSASSAPPPHGRYGPRATTVTLATALVCAALAAATGPRPEVAVWLLAAPVAVLLAVVDQAVQRLPDLLTLPLAVGTAALLGIAALLPAAAGSWPGALLGAVVLGAVYYVLFRINPKGLGFGDVKLAPALGAALGWYGWTVLFIGFLAGLLLFLGYGITLIVLRRAGRKSSVALGPFLLGGAFLGVLLGAL